MQIKTSLFKLFAFSLFFTASTTVHSFSLLGVNPTAWDPGANTARFGGFPAPGGATWSIIGEGVSDSLGLERDIFGNLLHGGNTTTSLAALNPSLDIVSIIDNAFDTWASVSNFTNLGQVDDSGLGFGVSESGSASFGDIRIGAIAFDGPGGVLAHAYQPGTEAQFINGSIAGDIHIDNDENWLDGFDLATVLLHEIGHALGLGHSDDMSSVMFAFLSPGEVNLELAADDIAGIQFIYGATDAGPAVVPLPGAPILFLSALGLIGFIKRRRASISS